MTNYTKKLAAWLHDPAEKQLVLMRDPAGHEGGTSRVLREELEISSKEFDHRADHLAAAADRPNWPRSSDGKPYPKFEAVHFAKHAQLIHPLSGERLDLPSLNLDVGVEEIKASSQAHFQSLIQEGDDRNTFLAFWRFGPEAGKHAHELGELWRMLPADSRVPDHSIWSHLDTVCAIHTALAGDEQGADEPALLVMSFGPVQGFIGQARSTSDLWAGSHLLSSLVWEAMKPIVSHLGPDAVVFPALRGVPVVDEWLMSREVGGDAFKQLFADIDSELLSERSDTNPLFAASLPNKFMAIVPSRQVATLAERAVAAIRHAAKNWAMSAAEKVFEAAGISINDIAREQVSKQLAGFPEAQWAAAVWPVGKGDDYKDANLARERLTAALDAIHPDLKQQGVFDPKVWNVITKELQLKDLAFSFNPNAGVLYPAVYELAERSLAAAKSTRSFAPISQEGHRCTLTGEAEWLTHERALLGLNRKDRNLQSVWGKLAKERKTWVIPGEHLGAIATLKRLWPTLFSERVNTLVGADVAKAPHVEGPDAVHAYGHRAQSSLVLEARAARPHLAISSSMNFANWGPGSARTSEPLPLTRCTTASSCKTSTKSRVTFSRTADGSPAGPTRPAQPTASKFINPGSPLSASVGTLGREALRCRLVTASGRTRPAWMCDRAADTLSTMNCTCPPIRSVSAGPLPL